MEDVKALQALHRSYTEATEAGVPWDEFSAFDAVYPYLKSGPSDATVIAFLAVIGSFVAFGLWLVFG